jgi:DNA-binding transcriptional LysR family regulator
MQKFTIAPEDCLILKAFKESKSLRDAARKLGSDPAGLTRKVQQISGQYGFLQKVNNRWIVTSRGMDMVAWVEDSIQSQQKLIASKKSLRIASTMWLSESQLIPRLRELRLVLGEDSLLSLSYPDEGFENSLLSGAVDFVIVCHPPAIPEIAHYQVATEKWIAIAPPEWKKNIRPEKMREFLESKPFIRHADVNQDIFLPGFKIRESGFLIDNVIGVRSAVCEGLGWSLAPEISVRREIQQGKLWEVPFDVSVRDRHVCLWWLRNRDEIKKVSRKVSLWLREACES